MTPFYELFSFYVEHTTLVLDTILEQYTNTIKAWFLISGCTVIYAVIKNLYQ